MSTLIFAAAAGVQRLIERLTGRHFDCTCALKVTGHALLVDGGAHAVGLG